MRTAGIVVVLAALLGAAASARADEQCLTPPAPRLPRSGPPIRFGVDPEAAGDVGSVQSTPKPEDRRKALSALRRLAAPHKAMVLRMNRLFWADGEPAIRRFKKLADYYTRAGFQVELQVRYHPAPADVGNMARWQRYVRHVVDVFGPNRLMVGMTITNEVNIDLSQNTSDGAYQGAEQALIDGIVAARDEARRRRFRQLRFGFTFGYRWNPDSDAAFWRYLADHGGAKFRSALGWVGLDFYPGSFMPPVILPTSSYRQETVNALALMRDCWMKLAAIPERTPIWVTENGYPTTPGTHTEAEQRNAVRQTVQAFSDYRGAYNVTDYRYFNLRDNDSSSTGVFSTDGLLRDDYSRKPSFAAYHLAIGQLGAPAPRGVRRLPR